MTGYTKLFSSIVTSTIWREPKETKILWITMLALADKYGVVEGSIPGLADMARLSIPETQESLLLLHSPDEFSRTTDHEGRRVKTIEGGWQILNHGKYREKMNADERREYLRIKKAESRERQEKRSTHVNKCQSKSTLSTHAECRVQSADAVKELILPSVIGIETLQTSQEFKTAWLDWKSHLAEKDKSLTNQQEKGILTGCVRNGPERSTEIIRFSIEKGAVNLIGDAPEAPKQITKAKPKELPRIDETHLQAYLTDQYKAHVGKDWLKLPQSTQRDYLKHLEAQGA